MKKRNNNKMDGVVFGLVTLAIVCLCLVGIICYKGYQTKTTTSDEMPQVRVPIILSYDGEYWLDQNNEQMTYTEAEQYFYDHPGFACKIIQFNTDWQTLPRIANQARDGILNRLDIEIVDYNQADYNNWKVTERDSYVELAAYIVRHTASEDVRQLLTETFYQDDVNKLVERIDQASWLPATRQEDSDRQLASFIFFGKVTELSKNNTLEKLCNNGHSLEESIPVILGYDGQTWFDQYGNALNSEDAFDFFKNHRNYAVWIFYLNGNQYYAPELHNPYRTQKLEQIGKDLRAYFGPSWSSGGNTLCGYDFILAEMTEDDDLKSTLQSLTVSLNGNSACYDIAELIDIIDHPENAIAQQWSSDSEFAELVYWGTLARAIGSGVYENVMLQLAVD